MITLFESDLRDDGRRSSKGNQLKWKNKGIWYKADYTGYEGLAEYAVSHLLKCSSLSADEFVLYDIEQISYKSVSYSGAKCKDFLFDDWQIITLERLFKTVYGQSLNAMIYHIKDLEERLAMIVNETIRITGLTDFGKYISKLLTIDSFFLNEDRHTHNIAVLVNGSGDYRLCPIFDQGAALLSDTTMDYPLGQDIFELIGTVKPKTFCRDFDEQLEISEKLYGQNLHFNFDKKEVDRILDEVPPSFYDCETIERVREILYQQIRKYSYLFG